MKFAASMAMLNFKKLLQIMISMMTAVLCGCKAAEMPKTDISKGETITILEATDLHYLSPSLCDNGAQFQATMKAGDGKMTEYSDVLLDRLIEDTIALKPSVLVLSGDITFNGEKISLQEIAEKLEKIKKAGIPIAVIPGNHDIEYPFAFQYLGENVKPVEGITTEDFENIMQDYGWNQALSKAPDSMSYLFPVSDDVVLMMLDANTSDNGGTITDKTVDWMKKQLEWAESKDIQIVAVSHQNILKQNEILYRGFVVSNYEEISSLLREYGVTLVLSGHSHLQHTSYENGLYDICTESLAVYPLQYGVITIGSNRRQFEYQNQSLDILQRESMQRFDDVVERQVEEQIDEDGRSIPKDAKERMIELAQKLNRSYFTGHPEAVGNYTEEQGWKDWEKYAPDSFFFSYMKSMSADE